MYTDLYKDATFLDDLTKPIPGKFKVDLPGLNLSGFEGITSGFNVNRRDLYLVLVRRSDKSHLIIGCFGHAQGRSQEELYREAKDMVNDTAIDMYLAGCLVTDNVPQ